MVEPLTIAGAMAVVKGALDSVKLVQDLLKKEKPDVSALRDSIQHLKGQLLDAKEGLLQRVLLLSATRWHRVWPVLFELLAQQSKKNPAYRD